MKKDKKIIIILSVLSAISALGTFFVLINYNLIYAWFGKFALAAFLFFPLIALILFAISSIFIFKKNKVSYVLPVAISLIGCILAFTLSNEASLSKIESDFLKHELTLIQQVQKYEPQGAGTYDLNESSLKLIIPTQKLQIVKIGNKQAYFFIALDASDRYEGYVYIPHGTPTDWDEYGQFTEPLDINSHWFYMSMPK